MVKTLDLPISTLAYIGDAVYELQIRLSLLKLYSAKAGPLHSEVIKLVNAEAQAEALQLVLPYLSESEVQVVKRAGNLSVPSARNVDPADYRQATAFETLIGYIYLEGDTERLLDLLSKANPDLEFDTL
ncbi:MAG: ribonuclease III [Clostridiaceae bacterium]|nr:ribonuclease III [Clostridiaceae bacterium]